ncbi:MAG: calcium/sodium antiporter, partial [Gammaproteobacteria bacterium]|nr:calcium/sodium antiporter [Gammaproteobacteria bacterium]
VLGWGAHILVHGAASFAKKLGVPPLVIGLTIIAIGTSVPEIVISLISAIHRTPDIAIGNAVGSNIANIGLVLGITAMVTPLKMRSRTIRKELPLLFLVMLLVSILLLDGMLSFLDAMILMGVSSIVVLWLVIQGMRRHTPQTVLEAEVKKEIPRRIHLTITVFQMLIGLVLLPIGSKVVVESATYIARLFHVRDIVIGLTVVAIGTSLPELATAIMGACKKEYEIVIGNIVGSNIFNLLAVLPISALLHPVVLHSQIVLRDFSVMFALTILLYIFSFGLRGPEKTTRFEGFFLLLVYVIYLGSLFFV